MIRRLMATWKSPYGVQPLRRSGAPGAMCLALIYSSFMASCRDSDASHGRDAVIQLRGATVLSESPSGALWMCDGNGYGYVSRDWGKRWEMTELPGRTGGVGAGNRDEYRRLCFFDTNHAILTGFIGWRSRNKVLWTCTGGISWSERELPCELYVNDTQAASDGHAWIVGSDGILLTSQDYGESWAIAHSPASPQHALSCVHFESAQVGYVGSLWNELWKTTDAGNSWVRLKTPADECGPPVGAPQHTSREPEHPPVRGRDGRSLWPANVAATVQTVQQLTVLGEWLLASQGGQVFYRSREDGATWRVLEVDGHRVVNAHSNAGEMIVVTDDQVVWAVSRTLEVVRRWHGAAPDAPLAIAGDGGRAAILTDGRGKVCTYTAASEGCSWTVVSELPTWLECDYWDVTRDGVLVGASSIALYKSSDGGQHWEECGQGEGIAGVSARRDGTCFVPFSEGGGAEWVRTKEGLSRLPGLPRCSVTSGVRLRRGALWIWEGYTVSADKYTQGIADSNEAEIVGPGFTDMLYASPNEGRTWRAIESHAGAIATALWLGGDDTLSVVMSDGAMRQGHLDRERGTIDGNAMQSVPPPPAGDGREWGTWLMFPEHTRGIVGARVGAREAVVSRTDDGGLHWDQVTSESRDRVQVYGLEGGVIVRIVGDVHEGSQVEEWQDGSFKEIRKCDPGVHDAHVDSSGDLLMRMRDGQVWRLEARTKQVTRVGHIGVRTP